ncbi:MAG TPA: helix-turn-helix domain-containing protein [Thermomicrobiaceae bacterium]|nr:helix-turn-helix domain-containing protein [Thermomicrobiaceae bacterium]
MAADAPEIMSIHQLEAASGVPSRRIRHFIAEGLLPPPLGKGRAAHYDRQHLELLRQIEALRAANLGLEEIRLRLAGEPERGGAAPESEAWRRWEIAPGIELHARADLGPEPARIAQTLAELARQMRSPEANDG